MCNEQRVYGDSAYASQQALIESKAPHAKDLTNQRVRRGGEINEAERSKNHDKSRVRARVEHVFVVVKRLWGFAKNATRSFVVLGLANIYLARQRLSACVRPLRTPSVQRTPDRVTAVKPRGFPASATLCAAGHSIWLLVQRSLRTIPNRTRCWP